MSKQTNYPNPWDSPSVTDEQVEIEAGKLGMPDHVGASRVKQLEFIQAIINAEQTGVPYDGPTTRLDNKLEMGQTPRGRPKTASSANSTAEVGRESRREKLQEVYNEMPIEELEKLNTGIPEDAALNKGTKAEMIHNAIEHHNQQDES